MDKFSYINKHFRALLCLFLPTTVATTATSTSSPQSTTHPPDTPAAIYATETSLSSPGTIFAVSMGVIRYRYISFKVLQTYSEQ